MFGFLKNLFAGIVSFITGLLPGKKNGGYYLQIDDETVTEPKPAAPKTETTNGTKATLAAEPATPAPTPKQPAKVEAATNGKAAPTEPTPAPVASTKTTAPTETTFAPKYLAPSGAGSNGRRRPGANMNNFLDMASQVKTPG
ncbi:hypothetical protein Nos7524_3056 [Nostoc sp. PCC 7524]|uniref:hypothetical protein n=1 Tax=Nostoc sp. (strain ATCC 29411 / PCC 7524) TaxID=28072 RepID=UPI00029F46A7|nr:hypothetical protein [Nostoc sp. PCC 7524]AFY48860.1 hypothetical protein Nos7524_3056 [Nostoc sp. PCC 7524]